MASAHQRGKKWAYSVHNSNYLINGLKKKITKSGFRTKKEAQLAGNKVEQALSDRSFIQDSNISFETFANEWLDYYTAQVKISSVGPRKIAMKHLVSVWGALPLKKITKHMYQSRIDTLIQEYSQNYTDSIHTAGNMIFKHAIRQDLLRANPTDSFIMPVKKITVEDIEDLKILDKFLELKELKLFISIAKEHGLYLDYLVFVTLAYTGMRSGELLALKWSDLNFSPKTLSITKTYYNKNNKMSVYEILPPKTKKSIRKIMIDDGLVALFKAHRREQISLKTENRLIYVDENFVFSEKTGYPRVMKQLALRLQRLLKHMDIDKHITPHSFRHTHTSLLIEAEAGVKEIQERLGHGDINTTMNIYAHMTKNIEEKTSQKFSQLTQGILE